jgi:uncharacterized oxidoreductase
MKTSGNTILITGGSAGIGLALAKQLAEAGNKVIITGRNEARLKQAAEKIKNVTTIQSDVANEADVASLASKLTKEFPSLNVVINNAGNAALYDLATAEGAAQKARDEFAVNYFSIIDLNEKLLPLLQQQPAAAIVNVSSIVAFAPNSIISSYSASKAALHSYSLSLRHAIRNTSVKVFELMPPLVNTDFSEGIGGSKGIPPSQVADELLTALKNDVYEIHVGNTADFYKLSLASPSDAFKMLNQEEAA